MPRVPRPAAVTAALAVLIALLAAAPAGASMTIWPTCPAPPAGDYARCETGAFPQSIIPGPDGAMWFTTARSDLGRVTPGGAFSQTKLPLPAPGAMANHLLGGLTVGPDGALWFPNAFGVPYLWRATPTSPPAFSATLTPGDTQPRQALLGPDGAIWLAEAKSNTLGRFVAPAGPYVSFPLPAKPAGTFVGPLDVVNGSDGRFWIPRPRDLVAVTTAGAATRYEIPGLMPNDAVAGPDGAIWVTGFGTDNVARVTTGGSATLFPLPAGSGPAGITTGPDGALWMGLGKSASAILRMTTDGAWTVIPLMWSSQISSLTTGPDGAIWFADLAGSRIGRLTLADLPGPAVLSLSPSTGPAGTVVRVRGKGLLGVAGVRVGGTKARFKQTASGVDVTIPPGAGAAPVVVSTGTAHSVPTDAATFSYATAAAPNPPAPPAQAAPTVTLGPAALDSTGDLTITVRASVPAPFDVAAALAVTGTRARIASAAKAGKLHLPKAGTSKGRFVRAGATRVTLRLSATARRAIARAGRRGARLEVGVRLRLAPGQTSIGQRSYRLRAR